MLAAGTVLQNRYVVERQIGEGGMGAVYIATDRRFGSTVALKETFFDDPGLRKAFEREAKLLNHLRHAALPRVSDHFGEGEGQFLVMEFIPGEDLSHMLKQRGGPFPLTDVLSWADQLLDALDYLHTQQPPVVHRDIKPQNLKLTTRNQIVLLDFGLAKGTPLQTRVTATGSVFGYSFNYAPIEQMQGTGTDPRSDLYSLGATLYHLLTGTPPPDALARATAVIGGEQDPLRPASDFNASVPAEIDGVLERAMRQGAAQRFASADEMRAALRQAGQVASARDSTVSVPSAWQTNVSQGRAADEGETRLMDAPNTNRIPLAETEELLEETAVGGKRDDASFAATEVVKGATPASANEDRTSKPTLPGASSAPQAFAADERREDKSVVTNISAAGVATAARGGPRRALGVGAAAGVVIVALVAAAVYSFTRREQGAPAAQPTPQATATAQPAGASPQSASPADNTQPAEPTPEREATRAEAQPRRTPAATAKNAKSQGESQPAEEQRPAPPPAAPPERAEPQNEADDDEAGSPFRNRDMRNNPPSQDEIDRWLAQHPHWLENHPNRARQLMRLRQQRRRNNLPPL
ncbi:MAG TPA: protein kinase [Pyrinomonadaceae bacterium]|nr:protein kinase [Pyrinomonadaceae bacterium]